MNLGLSLAGIAITLMLLSGCMTNNHGAGSHNTAPISNSTQLPHQRGAAETAATMISPAR